jgi:hypothetical protein
MRIIILTCLLFVVFSVSAQGGADPRKNINIMGGSLFYSVGGQPVITAEFFKVVEGSCFFNDEWMKGIIVLNNGNQYKNINTKLDLLKGNVHYQDQFGSEFIADLNIKEVILIDTVADINYRFICAAAITEEKNTKKPLWYQWLHSGTASLYKLFEKQASEQKPYNSATTEVRIQTVEKYFIHYSGAFFDVKKLKEIPSVLAIKKSELEAFLTSDKLTNITSKDDKFVALIQYFNFLMR